MNFTLTFDDGPSQWTPAILDLLAKYGLHAIFFVTGDNVAGHETTLRRAHREGHELGVHGWTHRRLTDPALTDNTIRLELADTMDVIEEITDFAPTRYRAPYFAHDERVQSIAASLGLTHMGADVIPNDWLATNAEALAAKTLAKLETKPGGVICFHDGIPPDGGSTHCTDSRQVTVDALWILLEGAA